MSVTSDVSSSEDSEIGELSLFLSDSPNDTSSSRHEQDAMFGGILLPRLNGSPPAPKLQMKKNVLHEPRRSFDHGVSSFGDTAAVHGCLFDPDEQTQLFLARAGSPGSADSNIQQAPFAFTNANYASPTADEDGVNAHQQGHQEQLSPPLTAFISNIIGGGGGGEGPLEMESHSDTKKPATAAVRQLRRVINAIYSTVLLIFSVWLVLGVVLTEKARLARDPHPFATTIISWFLLVLLATMEGGQGCLIGLQRVEKKNYASSHPWAFQCTTLAHEGDNMERFIIGRQFLVFLVVFLTNWFKVVNASPVVVDQFFLSAEQFWSGAAIILTTITVGQLTSQVNAATCMLDFINSRMMLFTTYLSLFIEKTGILHSCYIFQSFFSKIAGIPIDTKEKRTLCQSAFFWVRVWMSLGLLGFSFAVTICAILQGKTTMWAGIPVYVSAVLFFGLMIFIGMFEALQIALFEVVRLPEEYFHNHPIAKANSDLAFCGENLQAILVGRQMCVTIGVFMIARITTPDYHDDETIFGVSRGVQQFFNTGLLGVFITTIVASLAWRIVAASFPLVFLSNPLTRYTIHLCLLLDSSGICSASWLFALYHKTISGFRADGDDLWKPGEEVTADVESGGAFPAVV